jgi:predicted Zn-dependent protease
MEVDPVRFPSVDASEAVRRAEEGLEHETPAEALRMLRSLSRNFPDAVRLRHLAARVLESLGRDREAEEEYRVALSLDPESHEVALDLAELLLDQDRAAEGELLAGAAVEGMPDDSRALGILGEALKLQGKTDKAAAAFRYALQIDPDCAWAGRELCDLLFAQGDLDGARKLVLELLDRDPIEPYNYGFFGEILRRTGKTQEAMQAYETALWLLPEYSWAARQLAGLLLEGGQGDAAREVLHRSLDFDPEEPWLLACLWCVEKQLGNALDAEEYFRRALAKAPKIGDVLDCCGRGAPARDSGAESGTAPIARNELQ